MAGSFQFREIPFGGKEYDSEVDLRYEVLRKPLGLVFDPEDLALEYQDHHLAVFSPEDVLLACILMAPIQSGKVKMRQFAVRPQYQRQGIGKYLVSQSEEWAKEHGFARIELHARLTAVPFYEKLGYGIAGDIFTEVTVTHLFMFKDL